ncbi:hypothetical protein F3J14_29445 [Burkholderia sp. Tr-862]|nr:hypothetical protein [Burkholderia sp. Tr-862]
MTNCQCPRSTQFDGSLRPLRSTILPDKPGVGRMIYLPTTITSQQAWEARGLCPVPEAGKTRTGTIVVSTTGNGLYSRKRGYSAA